MLRILFITIIIVITFLSCKQDSVVEPFNYERDTPQWLKEKINYMSSHGDYYGTKVFRYELKRIFIYHFVIPVSSCSYCDVYNQQGTKIQFTGENEFQVYLNNRENELLIWEWKN